MEWTTPSMLNVGGNDPRRNKYTFFYAGQLNRCHRGCRKTSIGDPVRALYAYTPDRCIRYATKLARKQNAVLYQNDLYSWRSSKRSVGALTYDASIHRKEWPVGQRRKLPDRSQRAADGLARRCSSTRRFQDNIRYILRRTLPSHATGHASPRAVWDILRPQLFRRSRRTSSQQNGQLACSLPKDSSILVQAP